MAGSAVNGVGGLDPSSKRSSVDTGEVGADGGTESVFAGSSLGTLTIGRGTGLLFFCLRDSSGTCAAESDANADTSGAGVLLVTGTPFDTDLVRVDVELALFWPRSTELDLDTAGVEGVLDAAFAGILA